LCLINPQFHSAPACPLGAFLGGCPFFFRLKWHSLFVFTGLACTSVVFWDIEVTISNNKRGGLNGQQERNQKNCSWFSVPVSKN
jgi:hypothetical protein